MIHDDCHLYPDTHTEADHKNPPDYRPLYDELYGLGGGHDGYDHLRESADVAAPKKFFVVEVDPDPLHPVQAAWGLFSSEDEATDWLANSELGDPEDDGSLLGFVTLELHDPSWRYPTPPPSYNSDLTRRVRVAGCRTCEIQTSPPHDASHKCESGGYTHCSCDTCF